jgi:anti-anti-sigma factor
MLIPDLPRSFGHSVSCAVAAEQPRLVAVAPPAHRLTHSLLADAAVRVVVSQNADDLVIHVMGDARIDCADTLLAGLLAPAARRCEVVTLDLTELRSISSLAMGVLVTYRRGVVRNGGRVRLAPRLQPAVRDALRRADLLGLFECTADVEPSASSQAIA